MQLLLETCDASIADVGAAKASTLTRSKAREATKKDAPVDEAEQVHQRDDGKNPDVHLAAQASLRCRVDVDQGMAVLVGSDVAVKSDLLDCVSVSRESQSTEA